jgi:hypothetical protein
MYSVGLEEKEYVRMLQQLLVWIGLSRKVRITDANCGIYAVSCVCSFSFSWSRGAA